MRLEITFNHMDRSEHLEDFTREKLVPVVDELLHRNECHVMVWLMSVHSRHQKGVPEYRCEIEIRYPPKRDFFVSKSGEDMHLAIVNSVDAMANHLRGERKKEIDIQKNIGISVGH